MIMNDALGLSVTGANARSLEHYERALQMLRCYVGDPVSAVDAALAESPGFTMAHVLKAWLHLVGTESEALPTAEASHAAAAVLHGNDREQGHVHAIRLLLDGQWRASGRALEDIAVAFPRDALALQIGHQLDFFMGDSRMLRDRIARALPVWSAGMPGYHAILSMHAFGLEETGDYVRAEATGRRAVEIEPRDGWGQHAVAHVLEMQGRTADGIAWMTAAPQAWVDESFFAVHNWWHLALYHLEVGEIDQALVLFDGPIFGARSKVVLDLVDASAMLWRLHLRGLDVGSRWSAVAANWAPLATAGNYAFNDAHAMMAFVGAGMTGEAEALLQAQRLVIESNGGDNRMFTRDVGHPLACAIQAFAAHDYARTVDLLRPIRGIAARFGGSHAQRDIIDLTLLEASLRAGNRALAAGLAAERSALKPHSPLSRLFVQRAAPAPMAA